MSGDRLSVITHKLGLGSVKETVVCGFQAYLGDLMVSFFIRKTLDHYCAKLTFAHKSKTVSFTVQPAMEGSCFVVTEKCIHQMVMSTQYYTNDSIIPIEAPVQSRQLSNTF